MISEKKTLDDLRIDRSGGSQTWSWLWLLVVVLVLGGTAMGAVWWLRRTQAVEVRTASVREVMVEGARTLLNGSGYVTPRREATVSSKVTGKVVEVLIEEGMQVTEGQVLARLDDSNTKASLQLAEAQLASAKAALAETKARLLDAEKEFQRVTDLAATKIATQADLDHALAAAHAYRAHLANQEVDVAVAEKQLAVWAQQMEDLVIRAPFAGIVTVKSAQPGEMISPVSAGGGFTRTGICTVVDMASIEIEVDVNESYINRVAAGQPVEATLDAYPDWKIPAHVIAIIPTADRQKATVKVRVGFEHLDPRILPQMGVKVAFNAAGSQGGSRSLLVVPKAALDQAGGRELVLVLRENLVERRAIKPGTDMGEDVVVLSGLAAGEKVIVGGPRNLAEHQRVRETGQGSER